jgi:hypothetical protein
MGIQGMGISVQELGLKVSRIGSAQKKYEFLISWGRV